MKLTLPHAVLISYISVMPWTPGFLTLQTKCRGKDVVLLLLCPFELVLTILISSCNKCFSFDKIE